MRLTEQDWTDIYATTAAHYRWTVQEFATEMDRCAVQLGVTPEVPTTEDEFLAPLDEEI
jgi:hypothetical protein